MPSCDFASVLADLRKRHGHTQKSLASAIGKSPQYIAALEVSGERKPSLDALRDMVQALGVDPKDPRRVDNVAVLRLLLAAVDWDLPFHIPEVLNPEDFARALSVSSEVWVVTDVLPEAHSLLFAEFTAKHMMECGTRYVFLVPFSIQEWHVNSAIENLKTLGVSDEQLQKQLAIFRVSSCAVPARVTIINPRGANPQGFYHIAPANASRREIRRMPSDLLTPTIRTYDDLCSLFHNATSVEAKRVKEAIGNQELGYIKLVYPAPIPEGAAEETQESVVRLRISRFPGALFPEPAGAA